MPFITTAEQPFSAVETGHSKCRLWAERIRTRVADFGRFLPVRSKTKNVLDDGLDRLSCIGREGMRRRARVVQLSSTNEKAREL